MPKKVKEESGNMTSRERILSEAVRLFASKGFGGTGLRELAAAAGVNLAMINYFFGSKKGLLKEILDHFFSGYLAVARIDLAGPDPLPARVRRFVRGAVAYFEENRDALLVTITELPHDDPEILAHKANWGKQMMEILEREVCTPARRHDPDFPPARLISPLLTSMMASRFLFSPVISKIASTGTPSDDNERYVNYISDMILAGLGRNGCDTGQDGSGKTPAE
jgi:AcrR family transcriptional regulator